MAEPEPEPEPEPYKQDSFQVKINKIQEELESRFGKDFLDRIIEYSFRYALAEAKTYELSSIEDELSQKVAFSRLFRFRAEHALMETADYAQGMSWQGFNNVEIKHYLYNRISEVVVFE